MRHTRTNELEFQGQALKWIDEEIQRRPGLGLDKATQEKPRTSSGKRNDLVVWVDRKAEVAFLEIELKTPDTTISDPAFLADAIEKAQHWNAPFFAIWNMKEAELYRTPPTGNTTVPSNAIRTWRSDPLITSVDSWLDDRAGASLQRRAVEIVDASWEAHASGFSAGVRIDASIFVSRLTNTLNTVRSVIYSALKKRSSSDRSLRQELNRIAIAQGFIGFVKDIDHAISGQYGYRLIGQILFYFALRRKQSTLQPLEPDPAEPLLKALRPYWDEVRRYDYEALFKPHRLDEIVHVPAIAEQALRLLIRIRRLGAYDWSSLRADVLGSVFEELIPLEEQMLLGQFYTPMHVADIIVAFTMDGERPLVLDPGCGSGTFLMRAYNWLATRSHLSHQELLSIIWGFDLSPFATELAAINLYRQNLSDFDNFPRIVPGDFFQRTPGERVPFPPPHSSGPEKTAVPIPHFDVVIGNPPYLRSQNQDDLDAAYKARLFTTAARAGYEPPRKRTYLHFSFITPFPS